jgi:hypothetical protein
MFRSRFRKTGRKGSIVVLAKVETPMLTMKYQKCLERGRAER